MELFKRILKNVGITFLCIFAFFIWLVPFVYLVKQGTGISFILLIIYLVITIVPFITWVAQSSKNDIS